MGINFEEIAFEPTPIGDLVLRRRRMKLFGDKDIYEIKLGDDFLMTSLFHEAEDQLSIKALAKIDRNKLDVVVGGLGLGYTAVTALKDSRIESLVVVDYLAEVIKWHNEGTVPLGKTLTADTRCQLVHADFFALSHDTKKSFNPKKPNSKHDLILLDIDHTPTNVLKQTNKYFYSKEGLAELATHLKPGGIFAMWADGKPVDEFTDKLSSVFTSAEAYTIEFNNPITNGTSHGTVYVACT